VLRRTFESSGFEVMVVGDGAVAMDAFRSAVPRAVILEVCLPGKSGQDLCREIRSLSQAVPIVVLSSIKDEVEKVLLLELGADDYVTKPFSPRELLARVRTALRRVNQTTTRDDVIRFGDVEVNFLSMELFRAGNRVAVTPQELKVLRFFVSNRERVISDTELLNEVWKDQRHTTGTIRTHISRLRQKLEDDPRNPVHLRTVHRLGYRFVS
jgi:DNA-binding response OmpR family regulator